MVCEGGREDEGSVGATLFALGSGGTAAGARGGVPPCVAGDGAAGRDTCCLAPWG